jgi:hypothetical protein
MLLLAPLHTPIKDAAHMQHRLKQQIRFTHKDQGSTENDDNTLGKFVVIKYTAFTDLFVVSMNHNQTNQEVKE